MMQCSEISSDFDARPALAGSPDCTVRTQTQLPRRVSFSFIAIEDDGGFSSNFSDIVFFVTVEDISLNYHRAV